TLAATLHWQAIGPNGFGPAALGASALGLRPAPPIGLPTGAPARLARLLRAAARPPGGEWAGPAPGLSERASADPGALLRDVREIRVPRGMRGRYEIVLLVAEQTLPLGSAEVTPAPPPAVGPAPERALDARF